MWRMMVFVGAIGIAINVVVHMTGEWLPSLISTVFLTLAWLCTQDSTLDGEKRIIELQLRVTKLEQLLQQKAVMIKKTGK